MIKMTLISFNPQVSKRGLTRGFVSPKFYDIPETCGIILRRKLQMCYERSLIIHADHSTGFRDFIKRYTSLLLELLEKIHRLLTAREILLGSSHDPPFARESIIDFPFIELLDYRLNN